MKKLIDSGGLLLPNVTKNMTIEDFKNLIARTNKIAETSRMKVAWQTMQNLSYSERSEEEERSWLVSDF